MSTKKWSEPVEVTIFLSEYGAENVQGDPNKAPVETVVRNMVIRSYGDCDDEAPEGWTKIGRAQVSISLVDGRELLANRIASLESEERAVLAKAQAKATEIRRQINTLLAITNEAPRGGA